MNDELRLLTVDAFSDRPFAGNPAAVCFLNSPMDDAWMQSLAAEMNLSETAFVLREGAGFRLRWMTPTIEVDLCGHATLASAHAIWNEGIMAESDPIRFFTRSGELVCRRVGKRIELDFPASTPQTCEPPAELLAALAIQPLEIARSQFDFLVVAESERVVRAMTPDFRLLAAVATRGVIVTAKSEAQGIDFVSRFFAPASGIDEDPVTGSAHCCLGPYWSKVLGKKTMTGFQASKRGGLVEVEVRGDQVLLRGHAVTVLKGSLSV